MRPRPKRLDPNTVVLLKQVGIGVLVISVVALLLTGIWYGTRLPSLTITTIEASGGETIESAVVKQAAEAVLAGEYYGFVPRRFTWWYPEEAVLNAVSKIDRVYNVALAQEDTTLRITYDEYVPHALWCNEGEDEACLFLTADGYAFAPAPRLTGGSFLRFVTSGRPAAVGEVVVEKETYEHLHTLTKLLANQQWFIDEVEIDQVGDVFLTMVGGGELKITSHESPEQTAENLAVILASKEFSHLQPGNFQYIDLRYGNKVFVNEEIFVPDESGTTTASTTTPE